MPYIIEFDPDKTGPAYFLKGPDEHAPETISIKNYLTEITLSAVDQGSLEVNPAIDLLRDVNNGHVYNHTAEAFLQVASNLEALGAARKRKLILGAAVGNLSTAYALATVTNIEEWEDRRAEGNFEFVTREGYEADVTPKGLKPHIVSGREEIERCFGPDSVTAKTANRLGLNHFAAQFDLINKLGVTVVEFPESPHIVLGQLNRSGHFEPITTMTERF